MSCFLELCFLFSLYLWLAATFKYSSDLQYIVLYFNFLSSNQLMQNKKVIQPCPDKGEVFTPSGELFPRLFTYRIKPQTVLLAGYPPRQMKNLLTVGKAQRKGI